MTATIVGFPADAALIAAERKVRELNAELDDLFETEADEAGAGPINERLAEVEDVIYGAPPRTLAGATAKLRYVIGLSDRGCDVSYAPVVALLREVLAVLETQAHETR